MSITGDCNCESCQNVTMSVNAFDLHWARVVICTRLQRVQMTTLLTQCKITPIYTRCSCKKVKMSVVAMSLTPRQYINTLCGYVNSHQLIHLPISSIIQLKGLKGNIAVNLPYGI